MDISQVSSDHTVFSANNSISGLTVGAAVSLEMKDILSNVTSETPEEKTQMYHALLKHLGTLAGPQIRIWLYVFDDSNS